VSSEGYDPSGIGFVPDGTKMFVSGRDSSSVYQYTLTTGFDISTASYDNVSFDVGSEEEDFTGFAFNTDGSKMLAVGYDSVSVHQYSIPVGAIKASNRMSSSTLSALSDADLPVPGGIFELGIGIKFDSLDGSGNYLPIGDKTKPTYSGAVLNHDTDAAVAPAILGTDYTYIQPNSEQIVFTSLVDTDFNIKIT
jgi:hypothetical protein